MGKSESFCRTSGQPYRAGKYRIARTDKSRSHSSNCPRSQCHPRRIFHRPRRQLSRSGKTAGKSLGTLDLGCPTYWRNRLSSSQSTRVTTDPRRTRLRQLRNYFNRQSRARIHLLPRRYRASLRRCPSLRTLGNRHRRYRQPNPLSPAIQLERRTHHRTPL